MRAQTAAGTKPEVQILSRQYIEVNNLLPRKTEWSNGGRPIYDRLPAACEAYRTFFSRDGDEGYVYIPDPEGSEGPKSLRVDVSDDRKKVLISGGTTLWEHGQVEHNPVYIDLASLGIQNSKYLFAYQMKYGEEEQTLYEDVKGRRIDGLNLTVESSTDEIVGWRNSPRNAFSSAPKLIWKNYDPLFPSQPEDSFIRWSNSRDFLLEKVEAICPEDYTPNTGTNADLYVEGEFITSSRYSSVSNSYVFWMDNFTTGKTWEIRFQDSRAEVKEIRVDGKFPSLYKPKTSIMVVNLVAYPAYQYPEDGFTYCKLAHIDIDDQSRAVGKVEDLRNKVYNPFQPVADWLTRPWDDIYRGLYDEYSNFSRRRMSPVLAMMKSYEELMKEGIEVIAPKRSVFTEEPNVITGGGPSPILPTAPEGDIILDGGSPAGDGSSGIDGGSL